MKRILILLALLGMVLTGCEKQTTSQDQESPEAKPSLEELLESVQGNWVAISETDSDSGDTPSFVLGEERVPAVIIDGKNYFESYVPLSAECIIKNHGPHEISLEEDGKLSCSEDPSPLGDVYCKLELQGDKLIVTKTYSYTSDAITVQTLVRSDLPVKNAM